MIFAVEIKNLNKTFGGLHANRGVHLKVKRGSIHAIVGENGAGKSTAMKILYGIYQPDSGEILIHGKSWGKKSKQWSSPSDAINNGIGMIHQHFMLGAPYSVLENVMLGAEHTQSSFKWLPSFLRPLNRKKARKRLSECSHRYKIFVDFEAKISDLSVGLQQRVEILKLLYREAEILILDEPTAVLTPQETIELFTHLRALRDQGKTILMITHKLKEVMDTADRVTVFRAGKVVAERDVCETNSDDLATLMVGRKIHDHTKVLSSVQRGPVALALSGVSLGKRLKDLHFEVRCGEIVGVCGVEGNGQSELLRLILHPKEQREDVSGSITLFGMKINHWSAARIKKEGVAFIPEDRIREGLILDRPLCENFLLGLQQRSPFSKRGFLNVRKLKEDTREAIRQYSIHPHSLRTKAGHLSGGNQQKLIIARELRLSPRLLIAAHPTRGVDIGAIEFIHKKILDARSQGLAVLLFSSELEEIIALSDRIFVMYEGRMVAQFLRGKADERTLGLCMGGVV